MKKLEIGAWNKLPHYAVIGQSNDFYIWIDDGEIEGLKCASSWIKGRIAFELYYKLKRANKEDFISLVKKYHKRYEKY